MEKHKHQCIGGCGKQIGFKGFCSKKCHDSYYDNFDYYGGFEGT
jgi:hypothetical protein